MPEEFAWSSADAARKGGGSPKGLTPQDPKYHVIFWMA